MHENALVGFQQTFLLGASLYDEPVSSFRATGQTRSGCHEVYINRLIAVGLLELDREEPFGSRVKKYYKLTDKGREFADTLFDLSLSIEKYPIPPKSRPVASPLKHERIK